jgi:ATP-dependent helicase/nuclease subunit A
MSEFSPTPEQAAVIQSEAAQLLVSAAAGAGKTGTLVQRYLRFVEQGYSPREILAITFTRKAAAELRTRIVQELSQRGDEEAARAALTGPIQTIHGFCERVLRENSLSAGIDPDFEILEGSIRMVDEAVRRTIEDPPDMPEIAAVFRVLTGNLDRDGRHRLESMLHKAIERVRGTGSKPQDLTEAFPDAMTTLTRSYSALAESLGTPVAQWPPGFPDGALEFLESAGAKIPKAIRVVPNQDPEWAALVTGLAHMVAQAWRDLESRMRREQQFDFTLMEQLCVELMETSEEVRARVGSRYRVALIDEAQDNNPVQHRLLANLRAQSVTWVGDIQQSIYGFRLAEPRLFKQAMDEMEHLRLTINHRSVPGVQRFVDRVFGQVWGDDYVPMLPPSTTPDFERAVELWVQKQKDTRQIAEWTAQLIAENGIRKRDVGVLVSRGAMGVELKRYLDRLEIGSRLIGRQSYYTRMEIRDVANALRAVADPNDDFAMLAMLRSPFARLSNDGWATLALSRPVLSALREVTLSAEDQAEIQRFRTWFEPLVEVADRLPAWEIIAELYATSPFLANLARHPQSATLLANTRKLLTLAAKRPDMGPVEFAEEIREIPRLNAREDEASIHDEADDLVTISTIHSAKGLQFPYVVVAETTEKLSKGGKEDVLFDPRRLLLSSEGPNSPIHRWLRSEHQIGLQAEMWRVMYVALTRAQSKLCVVVSGSGNFGREIATKAGFKNEGNYPDSLTVRTASDSQDGAS